MIYKAIIFDIDGTAVPLGAVEAASYLQQAISVAQKNGMALAAATGRSFGYAHPIFKSLGLTCPSIIMSGSAIIDPVTNEVVWSKAMDSAQSDAVLELLTHYQADIALSTSPAQNSQKQGAHTANKPIYTIWATEMEPAAALRLTKEVAAIPNVTAHGTPSWVEGRIDIHITHLTATKEHAVVALLDKLGLQPSEVVGVGDSGNDMPIFKAVGHKIAMANGVNELKVLADEIAPPLSENGLAQIIEKYST